MICNNTAHIYMSRTRVRIAAPSCWWIVLLLLISTAHVRAAIEDFDRISEGIENRKLQRPFERHSLIQPRQQDNSVRQGDNSDAETITISSCRCIYPGEVLDVIATHDNDNNIYDDFVVVDGAMILLDNHPACSGVSFFCPGEKDDTTVQRGSRPWSYNDCPSEIQTGEIRRRTREMMKDDTPILATTTTSGLRGHHQQRRELFNGFKRPIQHSTKLPAHGDDQSTMEPPPPNIFDRTGSIESTGIESPSSYVILPSDYESCGENDGSNNAEEAITCTRVALDFEQTDDGRPLAGETFVADDWLPVYGIKITAGVKEGQPPQNLHPMVLNSQSVGLSASGNTDSELLHLGSPNEQCNGPGVGDGGTVGEPGENCSELGNLLALARRLPGGATTFDFTGAGLLIFDFNDISTVHSISLLNVLEDDANSNTIEVTNDEGSVQRIPLTSVGANGFQTVTIRALKVKELAVSLSPYAAIASLDICIHLPST